ncbi:MAG: LPS export ABC transporter periplasmic protein LptC [Parafilimonas terrae]|nr:LPS export ABC transporter periplasmic protein LptC [Parafilimonas terrae]
MSDIASIGPLHTDARQAAFRAAGRHSSRVKMLRRTIIVGAVLGVAGLVGFTVFNPFRTVIPSVSIDSVGLNGTKIVMDNPKLSGFKNDGRPYTLNARTAIQDARTPNVLELHEIDAHMTMTDKSVVHVVSSGGHYDSSRESMRFDRDAHITTDSGLDARLQTAVVDFKGGAVDTDQPVTVVMSTGTVNADQMHVFDKFTVVRFEGHVHSVMHPGAAATETRESLKGTGP